MGRWATAASWLAVLGTLAPACGDSGGDGDVADAADVVPDEAAEGTDAVPDETSEAAPDDGAGEGDAAADAADADADAEADVPACRRTGGRCFSFAQITDLHVGEGRDDYGTPGWDDAGGAEDERTAALRFAVSSINLAIEEYDIRFVAATGDFADSGERSEMEKARDILDQLRVPYLPAIGNHDMWPYTSAEEAPEPCGDRIFEEVFADHFETLEVLFDGFTKAPTPTYDPACRCESHFQNYGFDYEGFHFITLDMGTREHAPFGYSGVHSESELHDFAGGTWPWFEGHLAATATPGARNTFVFLHHPPIVTTAGLLDCLSPEETGRLEALLRSDGIRGAVWGFFAGHHHVDYAMSVYDGQHVIVMPATKDGAVRVVQLFGDGRVEYGTFL